LKHGDKLPSTSQIAEMYGPPDRLTTRCALACGATT
jgi:hypothetical protein